MPDSAPRPVRAQHRVRWLLLVIVIGVLAAVLVVSTSQSSPPATIPTLQPTPTQPGSERSVGDEAQRLLGTPRSGGAWFSGVWTGGMSITGARADEFGAWRGTPVDAATTYPATATWESISDSTWHISTFDGFEGVLVYGLPMLPSDGTGSFETIAAGEHDAVYRKVAQDLVDHGRGRSIVRVGFEANGDWFPWNTRAKDAESFKAAYRHIAGVLKAVAPELVLDFDVACGTKMRGQKDRMDTLTKLYPGDDVVDLIGCDTYDWYNTTTTNEASWARTKKPKAAVGIQDVADFARAHGKGLTFPEWGLADPKAGGAGDNPYFIAKMRSFFEANSDILVLESYFNEPEGDIANSIFSPEQAPRSAAEYARLW